jgi:hypothetical protein
MMRLRLSDDLWPIGARRRLRPRDDGRVLLRAAIVLLTGLAIAASPAQAQAQILVKPAYGCPAQTLERPFERWSDHRNYVLVGDGGFEAGASGWRTSRATVVAGSQPLSVRNPSDRRALRLSPGGRATSPEICVGLGHPSLRFFARNRGSRLGALAVEVVVTTWLGLRIGIPVGLVTNHRAEWSPTWPMPVVANLLTLTGGKTRIALRFTALGPLSTWEIDDVYVDPYSKR